MSRLQLKYFDFYGRGGTIRLLLKLANVDFEDVLIPTENWNEEKESYGLPLDQLPVLVVDGFILCQTTAIERFVASKAGLIGKCPLTDAKGEMLLETISDVRKKVSAGLMASLAADFPTEPGTFHLKDRSQENKDRRAAAMRENYNKMMNEKCEVFDKILKMIQTNEDFCVGDELSFVDIQLVSLYIFSKDVNVGHDFQRASPLTFKVVYFSGEKSQLSCVSDCNEHY